MHANKQTLVIKAKMSFSRLIPIRNAQIGAYLLSKTNKQKTITTTKAKQKCMQYANVVRLILMKQ